MVTRLPLTFTCPWFTNWRACGRVAAQPARNTTLSRRQLEQAEQVLAGDALLAVGLLVSFAELLLEEAVDVLRLLLLLQLDEVLGGVAAARAAVVPGRVGATLEGLGSPLAFSRTG